MNQKYEITEISHTQYPWLHQIRALKDIREDVRAGDLGGFVDSEENLSQEGTCWIYDDAIACEHAIVNNNGTISQSAIARGESMVTGNGILTGKAIIEDFGIVSAGVVTDQAHISGYGQVYSVGETNCVPSIQENAHVYGTVSGNILLKGNAVVMPGTTIENPTTDLFILDGKENLVIQDKQRAEGLLTQHSTHEKKKNRSNPER